MHILWLLHTVRLTKMPPHNSRFPSSFNGVSFQKTHCVAQILFSNQRTSATSAVSLVPVATEVLLQSHKHRVMCRHLWDLTSRTYYVLNTQSPPKQRPRAHLRRMVSVLSRQIHRIHLSFLLHCSPVPVPPKWDNMSLSPAQIIN